MKLFFALLAALVSLNTFAFDLCKLEDTNQFDAVVASRQVRVLKVSDNHRAFNALDVSLIHAMIRTIPWYKTATPAQALREFGDYYGNSSEPGGNAGEVTYYAVGNATFALVHYWPGDNEMGAFIQIFGNGSMKLLATVSDGWISCLR